MAIRSIGSSLVAKASPGSVSRKTTEERIVKPQIPGKGVPGSTERGFVEEPFLQAVPGGSERIVRTAPGAEAVSQASPIVPETAGLMAGSIGRNTGSPALRSGADNQALFQGGVSAPAAAPTAKGGTAARVTGMTSNLPNTTRPVATPTPAPSQGEVMGVQASQPNYSVGSFWPGAMALGGRAAADQPGENVSISKNFGQAVVGTLGNAINKIGTAFNAPNLGVGQRSQAYATNPSVTQSGQGSISGVLRSIGNAVQQAPQQLRSQAQNAVNKLRSIFKW